MTSTATRLVRTLRAAGCVFAEEEAELLLAEARTPGELDTMVGRRVQGEPLEVIVGWAEFYGLRIGVDAGVFVPRQRTRLLVEQAVAGAPPRPVVLDLCCGTAALGLAVCASLAGAELHASDIDAAAVRCARGNVGDRGSVYQGDLFAPLPGSLRGRVDLLLVNAPYVPSDAIALMPPEARQHEPLVALDGGSDGLDLHRRVAAEARSWLVPGGRLLIETSRGQAEQTAAALTDHGLKTRVVSSTELDATVVVGSRPR